MDLDVIVATRNRAALLPNALTSLLNAPVPPGLRVTITVVDNNSTDRTAQCVQDFASRSRLPIRCLFESRAGKSFALNTAIESTHHELVGFIDDDEQIEPGWYAQILGAFQEPAIDFVGGPYIPQWSTPAPEWLPRQATGVIGCFEFASTPKKYGKGLPDAVMFGGNAVVRRSLLIRVGPYRTDLVLHADQEMFERLLASGAHGMYLPQLAIHHLIPPERLQKSYFRRWMWRAGPAYARMKPGQDGPAKIAGIPRYLFKKGFRSLFRWVGRLITPGCRESRRFEAELDLIYSISLTRAHLRLRKAISIRFSEPPPGQSNTP